MSDNKRYYYLKVKETFFDGEEMKILESQQNGVIYQNLYLKMCLLSVKSGGALLFKDAIPYDVNMLSSVLRVNIDTVKTGIEIFSQLGLIEIIDDKTIYMTDIQSLIGQSSSEGERKKLYRSKIKRIKKINSGRMSGQLSEDVPKKTGHRTPELELKTEPKKDQKTEPKNATFTFESFAKQCAETWNDLGIKPAFRFTTSAGLTGKEREGFLTASARYSMDEIIQAMRNYHDIGASPEHEVFPKGYGLSGFLAGGVEKFTDDADPWTRCKKKQPAGIKKPEPVYGFVDDDEDFSK